jgi:uncharacterized protein YjbJ (UPF0337 family)
LRLRGLRRDKSASQGSVDTVDDQSPAERRNVVCMATKLEVKGNWNQLKGKLKQKYAQLTDDDLSFAAGKEDELLGRLQKKLGKSKEDLRAEIEKL